MNSILFANSPSNTLLKLPASNDNSLHRAHFVAAMIHARHIVHLVLCDPLDYAMHSHRVAVSASQAFETWLNYRYFQGIFLRIN